MIRSKNNSGRRRQQQSGVVLFLTLIAVIGITLVAVAMMRTTDTTALLSGNVAFKQSAVQQADLGVESALAAIPKISDLTQDDAAAGYFASLQPASTVSSSVPSKLHITTDDYCVGGTVASAKQVSGTVVVTPTTGSTTGNCVTYVIERMCAASGYVDDNNCTIYNDQSFGGDVRNPGFRNSSPYFRVTVRVDGPRNTVVFVQAVVTL